MAARLGLFGGPDGVGTYAPKAEVVIVAADPVRGRVITIAKGDRVITIMKGDRSVTRIS